MGKRKCKYCKTEKHVEKGVIIGLSFYCDYGHAAKWGDENTVVGAKMKAQANSKAVRNLNRTKLSWQHPLTQTAFNRMRVLQEFMWFEKADIKPYCISCLKENMDWCCGHFKTRGAHGEIKYDERNTFLQCNRYCNCGLNGNIEGNKNTIGYKKGLIHRFGETEGQSIIDYCERHHPVAHWCCEELEQKRKGYNAAIRYLEKELNISAYE
jgi:hypothetical protein